MAENKRFQKKKLDKEHNKKIKKAAKDVKKNAGFAGVVTVATPIIKKHGKDILNVGKSIIFKG